MIRRSVVLTLVAAAAALGATSAGAHDPGSDGGINGRSCGVLSGVSNHGPVGVTARGIGCTIARQVASGSVRGQTYSRWRCTGKRTRFGHCHGRGIRRRAAVGWFAAH